MSVFVLDLFLSLRLILLFKLQNILSDIKINCVYLFIDFFPRYSREANQLLYCKLNSKIRSTKAGTNSLYNINFIKNRLLLFFIQGHCYFLPDYRVLVRNTVPYFIKLYHQTCWRISINSKKTKAANCFAPVLYFCVNAALKWSVYISYRDSK